MNVYHEVLPTDLGRVMYRIKNEYRRFAPDWVNFVSDPSLCDVQVLDCIGQISVPYIRAKNYILLQHCFKASDMPDDDFWHPYWSKAKLIVSFADLPSQASFNDFNFLRLPIGVNPSIFYPENNCKRYMAMTTGYVAQTESLEEVLSAVQTTHNFMAHVGGHVFKNPIGCDYFNDIEDSFMRKLYNQSYYSIGLRKGEGFEAPIIEGLLCNARGVTYNYSTYKYWFGDLVEYIEDGDFNFVRDQLVDLFKKDSYRVVTEEERQLVKDKFSWEVIAIKFWNKVKESV